MYYILGTIVVVQCYVSPSRAGDGAGCKIAKTLMRFSLVARLLLVLPESAVHVPDNVSFVCFFSFSHV